MCFATAAAVASTVVGAGSSIAGGFSQGNAYNYQAAVARNNATQARQNAEYAAQAGRSRLEEVGLKERQQSGLVRAGLAANNLDVNTGSAADTQVSQREIGRLSEENVAHQAALESYGYTTQAANFTAESAMLKRAAAAAPWEGAIKGAGQLLGALPEAFGDIGTTGSKTDAASASLLSSGSTLSAPYGWMGQGGTGTSAEELFGEPVSPGAF